MDARRCGAEGCWVVWAISPATVNKRTEGDEQMSIWERLSMWVIIGALYSIPLIPVLGLAMYIRQLLSN